MFNLPIVKPQGLTLADGMRGKIAAHGPLPDKEAALSTPEAQPRRPVWQTPFLLYVFALLISYISVVIVPYAFADDYSMLGAAIHQNLSDEVRSRVAGGRPVLAALFNLTFSNVHGVSDLSVVRLGGIIILAGLAWLMYRALIQAGMNPRLAVVTPLCVCTLPAMQIFVTWAIAVYSLLAMVAGGAAAMLVDRAYDNARTPSERVRAVLFAAGAVFALVFALAIDQPPAMVYWTFAAISLLVAQRSLAQTVKRFVAFVAVAIIGMGLEYVLVRFSYVWIYGEQNTFARTNLVPLSGIGMKALLFFARPVIDGLNLYNVGFTVGSVISNLTIAEVMAVLILCVLPMYFRGPVLTQLAKTALALCLLPLSYVPNLVVAENWFSYRTQGGIDSLFALYAVLVLCVICELGVAMFRGLGSAESTRGVGDAGRTGTAQHRVALAVLSCMAAVGLIAAAVNVTLDMALPSHNELHVAVLQLEQQKTALATASSVYFIPDSSTDTPAPVFRYDEFGLPSAMDPWVPTSMAFLALRQVDPARANLPVIVATPTSSPPPGSVVINMHLIADFGDQALP